MTPGKRYRIKIATMVLAPDAQGRKLAITIPEGGIVQLVDGPVEGSRSLKVRWEGQTCEMFTQDLRDRGEDTNGGFGGRLPF
jgi:hypothetical protein